MFDKLVEKLVKRVAQTGPLEPRRSYPFRAGKPQGTRLFHVDLRRVDRWQGQTERRDLSGELLDQVETRALDQAHNALDTRSAAAVSAGLSEASAGRTSTSSAALINTSWRAVSSFSLIPIAVLGSKSLISI